MVAQFRGQLTKELGEGASPRCLGSGATPPNNGLKEIALDLVATCAEISTFAANKIEMSHGDIE